MAVPAARPAAAADAAFEVTGDRQENFRAAVTLRNPDDRRIGGWTLDIRLDRTVVQAFGAEAEQVEKGLWRFRPVDWTREIPAKGDVRFTFIGRPGGLGATPPEMKLEVTYAPEAPPPQAQASAPAPAPASAPASATQRPAPAAQPPEKKAAPTPPAGTTAAHTLGFKVKDSWADGFVGEVAVINGSDKTLRPWRFEFALDGKIDQAWGAKVERAGDGRWVARPEEYNSELEPGAFATFGFKASTPFKSRPTATALKQGE